MHNGNHFSIINVKAQENLSISVYYSIVDKVTHQDGKQRMQAQVVASLTQELIHSDLNTYLFINISLGYTPPKTMYNIGIISYTHRGLHLIGLP